MIVPILAIISGLLLGGLLVALSTEAVYTTWSESPLQAISNAFKAAWESYVTLFTGSFGTPSKIIAAIQSGDDLEIRRAFNPVFESLVKSGQQALQESGAGAASASGGGRRRQSPQPLRPGAADPKRRTGRETRGELRYVRAQRGARVAGAKGKRHRRRP